MSKRLPKNIVYTQVIKSKKTATPWEIMHESLSIALKERAVPRKAKKVAEKAKRVLCTSGESEAFCCKSAYDIIMEADTSDSEIILEHFPEELVEVLERVFC